MSHSLRCRCGRVRGAIDAGARSNRVVCYCKDCQAFAHFLGRANEVLDERGGSDVVQGTVNTQSAQGEPKPKQHGVGTMIGWFIRNALKARFTGEYKQTPFFRADGAPIVTPQVLSSEERAQLMRAVLQSRSGAPSGNSGR